jgi:NAD(P)-dependent dehydrogenase (short-subunit alcohol dehydrogenase family)
MPGRLENKVALVTGGGQGIGRAIAEAFSREGADVAIAEINAVTGQDAAQAIQSEGRRCLYVACDVAKKADIDRMVACVIEHFGRIDILVNNAGIHIAQPFLEVTEEVYDRTLDTNLKSQFFCAQAVARHMVARRRGKIINISSVSAEIADPGASHYCVGKGGTRMLTRAAALELAPHNIQVNSIAPGTIKTALPWYDTEECVEYCKKFVPAGRFAMPHEVTGAAVFLASDESDYVTGSSVTIDGGLTVQ